MTEEQLDRANVVAALKKVDRKSVSQRMRCDRFGDAAKLMRFLACLPYGVSGDVSARDATRKQPLLRLFHLPPISQNLK